VVLVIWKYGELRDLPNFDGMCEIHNLIYSMEDKIDLEHCIEALDVN